MGGMGEKGKKIMYHYITDKVFLKEMKYFSSNLINQLVQLINNDECMTVEAHLVGSGARNLITQNAREKIDLDYNLELLQCTLRYEEDIKDYVQEKYNVILNRNGLSDCNDSTSVLTTKPIHFIEGTDTKTEFTIDLAIVKRNKQGWHRLIHEKNGKRQLDRYYWNLAPESRGLKNRVDWLKEHHYWQDVIDLYLDKKNMYLRRNDHDHPSFIVYIETINELYRKYK